MSTNPDIRELDGKLFKMDPHPDAGSCVACMFKAWACFSPVVMEQTSIDDNLVMGHKVTLCWGLAPFSPCPCVLCCGVGPCAAQFQFKKDTADPTKWTGTGSVFKGGCCLAMSNHEGDTFHFDHEHRGTKEKPMEMVAGRNQMNPP